ncbi:MAG: M23 family metallopeptidase [Candidatus Rokubacteria bacterium]|nr:M23 family metallopeptidase [Candidatus Rokubacteria bacterium]
MKIGCFIAVVSVFLGLAAFSPAEARSHFMGKKGDRGEQEQGKSDAGLEPRMRIRPSGLVAVFPAEAACPDIASPFGSSTRYDGSRRPSDRYGGLHGGIDISLEEGTPLRAIAAGQVISAGTGGLARGIYLWLQHSPQETGLPFWVYSKYQHLRDIPELKAGETVTAGQIVGLSGKTGTVGRHYGPAGYPHLHLTTFAVSSDRYEVRGSSVVAPMSRIFDPVTLYVKGLRDVDEIERLSGDQKNVPVPYVAEDGSVHPAGAPVVWPVACRRR